MEIGLILAAAKAFLTSKTGVLVAALLASPVVASMVVRLLNKIPLEGWFAMLRVLGKNISRLGYLKLHRPIYEPIETWFQNFLVGSVNALNEGLDADDGTEASPAASAPALKSLVLLAGLLLAPALIQADTYGALNPPRASVVESPSFLRFRAGDVTFAVPFLSNLEGIGAYDLINKKGLVGVESVVTEYKRFEGTLSVLTDANVFDGDVAGTLAVGARRQIPQWKLHIGIFIGRDFRDNVWRGGIKGSKAFFGGAAD